MSTPTPTHTPTPTKNEIQQLKSVRDDMCTRFREIDNLMQGISVRSTPGYRRSKVKCSKLTRQITAVNIIIKHLETQTQ